MLAWEIRSSASTFVRREYLRERYLAAVNSGIRAALGALFSWKLGILITVIVLSVLFYRPFCKWLCPLGAFLCAA